MLWDRPSGEMVSLAVTIFSDGIISFTKSHLIYTMRECVPTDSQTLVTLALQWRPGDGMKNEC